MEIIKADISHAQDLGYVHAKSWRAAYRGIAADDVVDAFTPQKRAEAFEKAIPANPDEQEYYLFKVDGRPAGMALLCKKRDEADGEIYAIYFHPDFWGSDATHQAFAFCVRRLKEQGCGRIFIWVLEKNERARRFYEKYGFTLDDTPDDGTQQVDFGVPLTGVRYVKKL